jgi:hypothetical protein
MMLSAAQTIDSDGRMNNEWRIGKDMETAMAYFKVLSWHLPVSQENHEKTQSI